MAVDTKQRIADAALEQFHRKGFVGTSVQDLATAAGAPKGTFYNHFASKDDLAIATVHRYGEQMNYRMLADATLGSPRERLDKFFADLVAAGLDVAAEKGCLMANLAGEVPAHSSAVAAAIAEELTLWVSLLSQTIEEGKAAGELETVIPSTDLATFLVNAWEGSAVMSKAQTSVESVRNFERMLPRLLN